LNAKFKIKLIVELENIHLGCNIDYAIECAIDIGKDFNDSSRIIQRFIDKGRDKNNIMDAADGKSTIVMWLYQHKISCITSAIDLIAAIGPKS